MTQRTVFNGHFSKDYIPTGFNKGDVIRYSDGKTIREFNLEDFAAEILNEMEFTDNLKKPNGPKIKIIIKVEK